jgi:hypothetical protein
MIATIIIISLAYTWLLLETRYLRLRLDSTAIQAMYGQSCEWIAPPEYVSWESVCNGIWALPERHQPFWYKHPENLSPLCGVAWLKSREHPVPIPRVQLYFGNGYKQTFTLRKPELMKQIIKINTGKKYFKELALQP